jgi:hypothetical protein
MYACMYIFAYHSYLITYMISKRHAYTMLPHARKGARFVLVYLYYESL